MIASLWGKAITEDLTPHMTIENRGALPKAPSRMVVRPHALRDVRAKPGAPASDATKESPDYELLAVLAEGGMGVLYEARQTSIDRTVALKMLKAHAAEREEMREQFLAEAAVTGSLDHPNIVPVYELGADEKGRLFYAMKRVKGTAWSEVLRGRSLHENLDILMRVSDAVAFAHSRGVIHRDLKPHNVMLGDYGEVLLIDWGMAAASGGGGESQQAVETLEPRSVLAGTPAYLPPEMARGDIRAVGEASDVYLLGAILYEIVAGHPPHPCEGGNTMAWLYNAATNKIRPTEQKGELVDIALRALATEPRDRYASVKSFQQAVRDYEGHWKSSDLAERAEGDLAHAEKSMDYDDYVRALEADTLTVSRASRFPSGLESSPWRTPTMRWLLPGSTKVPSARTRSSANWARHPAGRSTRTW